MSLSLFGRNLIKKVWSPDLTLRVLTAGLSKSLQNPLRHKVTRFKMWDLGRRMRPEHLEIWFHNLGYFILCIYSSIFIEVFFGYVAGIWTTSELRLKFE